jgi:hypothetical protein
MFLRLTWLAKRRLKSPVPVNDVEPARYTSVTTFFDVDSSGAAKVQRRAQRIVNGIEVASKEASDSLP